MIYLNEISMFFLFDIQIMLNLWIRFRLSKDKNKTNSIEFRCPSRTNIVSSSKECKKEENHHFDITLWSTKCRIRHEYFRSKKNLFDLLIKSIWSRSTEEKCRTKRIKTKVFFKHFSFRLIFVIRRLNFIQRQSSNKASPRQIKKNKSLSWNNGRPSF